MPAMVIVGLAKTIPTLYMGLTLFSFGKSLIFSLIRNSFENTHNFIFQAYHYVHVDASVVCSVSANALVVCQPTRWPMCWQMSR